MTDSDNLPRRCPACGHILFEVTPTGEVVYKRGDFSWKAVGHFVFICRCAFVLRYNTSEDATVNRDDNLIIGPRADATADDKTPAE